MESLTKEGFVFIDGGEVYWWRYMHHKNLKLRWSDPLNKWIHDGEADMNQKCFWESIQMSKEHAMVYHKMHEKTTGDNLLNF